MFAEVKERLRVSPRHLLLYIVVFLTWGVISNSIGKAAHIAEFGHSWQILTCYGLYLIPVSLFVRHKSLWDQYLFGLFALAILELLGYSFGTSVAHEGNIFDQVLGVRNFTLAMTVFFAIIPPVGNTLVQVADRLVPGGSEASEMGVAPASYGAGGADGEQLAKGA